MSLPGSVPLTVPVKDFEQFVGTQSSSEPAGANKKLRLDDDFLLTQEGNGSEFTDYDDEMMDDALNNDGTLLNKEHANDNSGGNGDNMQLSNMAAANNYNNNNNSKLNTDLTAKTDITLQIANPNDNISQNQEAGSQDNSSKKKNREVIFYPNEHQGPYHVLVDTATASGPNSKGPRNELFFYEKIKDLKIDGILLIKSIGRTLFKVKFNSAASANAFALMNLKHLDLVPFIPASMVYKYGVLRGVPLTFSDKFIIENIESHEKVISVQRFTKRIKEGESFIFNPTYSVKIGFLSNSLPEEVYFAHTIIKVHVYYPPIRQCNNCGKFGHTANSCRGKKTCLKCGRDGVCQTECDIVKCSLCGGTDHSALNKRMCPKWKEEEDIKKIMVLKNFSRQEVVSTFSTNYFSLLENYDGDFPELPTRKKTYIDPDKEVNKILTRRMKYSSAVTRKNIPRVQKPNFPPYEHEQDSSGYGVFFKSQFEKVSSLEKTVTELTKLAMDSFAKENNVNGIQAINHLKQRISKSFVDIGNSFQPPPIDNNHENSPTQLSEF